MSNKTLCVIPARYASTRLPGKPLKDIAGMPMICRVYDRASLATRTAKTVVATDDKRIETVEVDLQQMKVVQCYGACDKFTIYHDRIVSLVNDNMNIIKQCMTSKQIAI